jgi:Ca2+-binding RTX toxin-like protein
VLDGQGGDDTMIGGDGNDTYVVDDAGDVVTEHVGEGTDTVQSSIDYTLGANLDDLTLTDGAINGTGNELANVITGNGQDNMLDGADGNDALNGNDGADVLSGGTGDDILSGGADNDLLLGVAGDDHLVGGTGADTMRGGSENDTYQVDSSGDLVIESANQGTDTVDASISYTLGANVENLVLTGTENHDGTGNALANAVTGNDGDNSIDGMAGNDVLTGGAGDDTFVFSTALDSSTNVDQVTDFSLSDDMISLSHSIFGAIDTGELSAAAFHTGTDADDAAQRIIYNDATGALSYDADGSGSGAAAIQFATLSPALSLDHEHFVVA